MTEKACDDPVQRAWLGVFLDNDEMMQQVEELLPLGSLLIQNQHHLFRVLSSRTPRFISATVACSTKCAKPAGHLRLTNFEVLTRDLPDCGPREPIGACMIWKSQDCSCTAGRDGLKQLIKRPG